MLQESITEWGKFVHIDELQICENKFSPIYFIVKTFINIYNNNRKYNLSLSEEFWQTWSFVIFSILIFVISWFELCIHSFHSYSYKFTDFRYQKIKFALRYLPMTKFDKWAFIILYNNTKALCCVVMYIK